MFDNEPVNKDEYVKPLVMTQDQLKELVQNEGQGDYRVYNQRRPDGTYPSIEDWFNKIAED